MRGLWCGSLCLCWRGVRCCGYGAFVCGVALIGVGSRTGVLGCGVLLCRVADGVAWCGVVRRIAVHVCCGGVCMWCIVLCCGFMSDCDCVVCLGVMCCVVLLCCSVLYGTALLCVWCVVVLRVALVWCGWYVRGVCWGLLLCVCWVRFRLLA